MELIAHAAPDAPRAVGNYAQALEVRAATRFLFVSGQIPLRLDGVLPKGFSGQARQVWAPGTRRRPICRSTCRGAAAPADAAATSPPLARGHGERAGAVERDAARA